jgi:hypothetical protein
MFVLILLCAAYIGYEKRKALATLLSSFIKEENNLPQQLEAMNNTFVPEFEDFHAGKGEDTLKILILGNSLSYHGISTNIGWMYNAGMAASTMQKDYAHLILSKLSDKMPHYVITLRISNFASFERNSNSLKYDSLENLASFGADIIIFQLGENVKDENVCMFYRGYVKLINYFKRKKKSTKTICTTPFISSTIEKNSIIENVALRTNSFLVDLSHLPFLDKENYAKNERNYNGNKSEWKADGIGMHPGDIGMENIARLLFIEINGLLNDKE